MTGMLLALHAPHYMCAARSARSPPSLLLTVSASLYVCCQWLDKDDSGTVEETELTTGIYLEPQQTESLQAMLGSLPPYDISSVDLFGFGR